MFKAALHMDNTISIQNLSKNIDASKLCDEFESFGKILSAKIEVDHEMKSIGEAQITFQDYVSALNSVKFMNNKIIENKYVCVSFLIEDEYFKKVFVKNFSHNWDECDLLKFFESIGGVEQAKISEDNDGNSNGYGYIVFKTYASARKVVERWNGKILNGQKLIVERFKRKSERDNFMLNSLEHAQVVLKNSTQKNNLIIKNLPKDMKDNDLTNFLKVYGKLLSVKVIFDDVGVSKGFGFACFKSVEDAEKACKRLNGAVLNNKRLEVNFKQDRNAREHYLELQNKERLAKQKQYKYKSQSASALQFYPHKVKSCTLMKI